MYLQNPECFVIAVFIFQMQYIVPSLRPIVLSLCLKEKHFLSSQGTLHSLELNTPEFFLIFFEFTPFLSLLQVMIFSVTPKGFQSVSLVLKKLT